MKKNILVQACFLDYGTLSGRNSLRLDLTIIVNDYSSHARDFTRALGAILDNPRCSKPGQTVSATLSACDLVPSQRSDSESPRYIRIKGNYNRYNIALCASTSSLKTVEGGWLRCNSKGIINKLKKKTKKGEEQRDILAHRSCQRNVIFNIKVSCTLMHY